MSFLTETFFKTDFIECLYCIKEKIENKESKEMSIIPKTPLVLIFLQTHIIQGLQGVFIVKIHKILFGNLYIATKLIFFQKSY